MDAVPPLLPVISCRIMKPRLAPSAGMQVARLVAGSKARAAAVARLDAALAAARDAEQAALGARAQVFGWLGCMIVWLGGSGGGRGRHAGAIGCPVLCWAVSFWSLHAAFGACHNCVRGKLTCQNMRMLAQACNAHADSQIQSQDMQGCLLTKRCGIVHCCRQKRLSAEFMMS
jgi:hypothetical protein